MSESKCESYCNGKKDYTDGVFSYCQCEAAVMNAVCEANIKKEK